MVALFRFIVRTCSDFPIRGHAHCGGPQLRDASAVFHWYNFFGVCGALIISRRGAFSAPGEVRGKGPFDSSFIAVWGAAGDLGEPDRRPRCYCTLLVVAAFGNLRVCLRPKGLGKLGATSGKPWAARTLSMARLVFLFYLAVLASSTGE